MSVSAFFISCIVSVHIVIVTCFAIFTSFWMISYSWLVNPANSSIYIKFSLKSDTLSTFCANIVNKSVSSIYFPAICSWNFSYIIFISFNLFFKYISLCFSVSCFNCSTFSSVFPRNFRSFLQLFNIEYINIAFPHLLRFVSVLPPISCITLYAILLNVTTSALNTASVSIASISFFSAVNENCSGVIINILLFCFIFSDISL